MNTEYCTSYTSVLYSSAINAIYYLYYSTGIWKLSTRYYTRTWYRYISLVHLLDLYKYGYIEDTL